MEATELNSKSFLNLMEMERLFMQFLYLECFVVLPTPLNSNSILV